MLNKDNYVPWLSCIIRYARSRPNGKMIVDSIENGPYVRRMIGTPGEPDLPVSVPESFHEQTDEELIENDIKQMDADDQAIQTILLDLPGDVYATVDSCETAKEIWERVRQMMKGSDIGEREKKAKLFNEWEKFTSTDGESIESYYHHFMQLMNDLKRNKHFLENIVANLKFLNNLQPEWKRHVTIVYQTKNLHEANFTQIYDFLKMNQDENGRIQVAHNAVQNSGNQNRLVVVPGIANQNGTGNIVAARAKGIGNGNQASMHPHLEEQYTDLLDPIPEPQLVSQNDNHVTSVAPSMVQSRGTVETSFAPNEETRAHQETTYHNLVDQVAQVNMVNCNMRATNSELKSELARYKIQEQRIEISQEKYDKLEKCYQKFVYQEQCLTRKINALHLSSAKQITTLNDEISNLNKQLSKEKSTISSLMEEKKRLKHDFKTREDKYLDKEVNLEAKIKDLDNILLKRDQTTNVTPHVDRPKVIAVTPYSKKLHALIPSHSVPQPREFNVVKHSNVIAPGMFKINPSQTSRENACSDTVNASSTGLVHTARTRRPQPKGNIRNARVPSASKSSEVKKISRLQEDTCFIRDLDGFDLLKGNRSTNLYTINLYDMASASPICLMARATPTKLWLWHQRLSHLSFDTINDLAKNDLVFGLPKFKYAKEHLCPSCEKGKSKRSSQPPKPILNSKQRLHLLHMDLCGLIRVANINGQRYVLVIVDDYSLYTWVHFLRTKDETREVIKNFLKKIFVRLQAPVIIVHTDNENEFKNYALKEYFDSVDITHETSAAKIPQQNGAVERRNRTLVEAARTMLIFSHAPLLLWAEAINDREDISKLGAKGDIGFFIGYSVNSAAYRVYNRRTKKIIETMNVVTPPNWPAAEYWVRGVLLHGSTTQDIY
nr:hypothetical protein [Tanacetum cinerariifolium]